jgi:hypothetical protein
MAEDQHSDPAKAFEDLRAEVSVLRKAVEALPGAMHDNRPPDYAPDLAVLGKGLDEIGAQLDNLLKSPALRQTPEQQGQSIAHAGSAMIQEAAQKLERAAQESDRERYNLSQMIGTLGTKERRQRFWTITLPLVFLVGFVAFPIAMRVMPSGFKRSVAAIIIGASQWDAGTALMQSGNPNGWEQLRADAELVSTNRDKINECRNVAAKTKKDERCTITVRATTP